MKKDSPNKKAESAQSTAADPINHPTVTNLINKANAQQGSQNKRSDSMKQS